MAKLFGGASSRPTRSARAGDEVIDGVGVEWEYRPAHKKTPRRCRRS